MMVFSLWGCNKEESAAEETTIETSEIEVPSLPDHLSDLFDKEEHFHVLDNDLEAIHAFMAAQCRV